MKKQKIKMILEKFPQVELLDAWKQLQVKGGNPGDPEEPDTTPVGPK